jgi:hypothetical protein
MTIVASAARAVVVGSAAVVAVPLLVVVVGPAHLVARLGLDVSFASQVANLLGSAGTSAAVWAFPFLAPFTGTLTWLLRFGTDAVAAF